MGRIGVLDIGTIDSRIDKGNNASESSGSGKRSIGADRRDRNRKGVEVLLCLNEGGSSGNDLRVITKFGDDLIGKDKLFVR